MFFKIANTIKLKHHLVPFSHVFVKVFLLDTHSINSTSFANAWVYHYQDALAKEITKTSNTQRVKKPSNGHSACTS